MPSLDIGHGARLCLTLDTSGLLLRVRRVERRLRETEQLRARMAEVLRKDYEQQFTAGGDPPWKRLAPSTIAARAMLGADQRILVRTGALRASWTRKDAPGHVERSTADGWGVSVGSALPYARYHQLGSAPHVIRAVRATALRFIGADGRVVFRRSVRHPGTAKRPLRGTEDAGREIARLVREWLATVAAENGSV